mgnify:CR=1 FL=1
MVSLLEAALAYAAAGWAVVPLHTPESDQCSCGKNDCRNVGKHPRTARGLYDASKDADIIRGWWLRWPNANIAIVTGSVSGIWAADIDSKEGLTNIRRILSRSDLHTRVSRTGSGGYHLLYRHPGRLVPNQVKPLPGVDVRGDGGYIVVPPSLHASGKRYEWLNHHEPLKTPKPLLELVANGKSPRVPIDWTQPIEEGQRDVEITRKAGVLFRAGLPAPAVYQTLLVVNKTQCHPPLPETQVRKIVVSIARREKAKTEAGVNIADPGKFRVLRFDEALRQYGEEELEWAINGWLPVKTIGLVVAPPGTYKTWLLCWLAVSISTGRPFLGHYQIENTGPVLFIQQEDPFSLLFERIAEILAIGEVTEERGYWLVPRPPPLPDIYWHPDRSLKFSRPASVAGLEDAIRELKPVLVIIDPLYSATDTEDFMARSAQDMLVLKRLRDRYGCSFLIAHHTTKGRNDSSSRESLWGSQFINAWLETGWQVRALDEGVVKLQRHFKQTATPEALQIEWTITPYNVITKVTSLGKSTLYTARKSMKVEYDDEPNRSDSLEPDDSTSNVTGGAQES